MKDERKGEGGRFLFHPSAFILSQSGYGYLFREIDVLDGIKNFDAVGYRPLERFTAGDEAGAAGALVDNRRLNRLDDIILTGGATRVDQTHAAHITVGDLVAS